MIKKHMTGDFLPDKDKQSVIDFSNSGENQGKDMLEYNRNLNNFKAKKQNRDLS